MSDNNAIDSDEAAVSLRTMPRSALQAIYHAVTGKTENLSKNLRGNVIIKYHDFEQLHRRIVQQIEHYSLIADPTVTIVVKDINSENLQYSSWERFSDFQINSSTITSEVSIKYEFLLQLPGTPAPQRFIISVGLDSGLPVVHDKASRDSHRPYAGFFMFLARDFPTIEISVDFVDFLIAKIFTGVVEEWFNGLEKIINPTTSLYLMARTDILTSAIFQMARVGFGLFLASYIYFTHGIGDPKHFVYGLSIGIILWSILAVLSTYINKIALRKIFGSICPSVIIFTEGDTRAFSAIKERAKSAGNIVLKIVCASIGTVLLNILSSYLFALL
jgi:hypothetical protein